VNLFLSLALFFVMLISPAWAEVIIKDAIAQKGYFIEEDTNMNECLDDSFNSGSMDYCGCEADVHYPIFSGIKNFDVQENLNKIFANDANNFECKGIKSKKPNKLKDKIPSVRDYSFKITFRKNNFLSIVQDWHQENAGAAHGLFGLVGKIVYIETGELLGGKIIFGIESKNYSALNEYIIKGLIAKNIGYIEYNKEFHDERKQFISIESLCEDCSLYIDKKGRLKISFDPYVVASMADGIVELTIPKKFVTNKELADILQE